MFKMKWNKKPGVTVDDATGDELDTELLLVDLNVLLRAKNALFIKLYTKHLSATGDVN